LTSLLPSAIHAHLSIKNIGETRLAGGVVGHLASAVDERRCELTEEASSLVVRGWLESTNLGGAFF